MTGIVLLGPPGVGKGTQARRLNASLGLLYLSTGDALRQAVSAGTELGRKVKDVMASGKLVSDDLVGEVVAAALAGLPASSNGFLLDGFPRTLRQVAILDGILENAHLTLDHALFIDAPEDILIRRVTGRRVCPACEAVFHVDSKSPAKPDVCDACGGALVQRKDDSEGVVTERLRVYRTETTPVVAVYSERGILRRIDGAGAADAVYDLIVQSLRGVAA